MQEISLNYRQSFLILLHSNLLARTTSSSPVLTTSEKISSLLPNDISPDNIESPQANSSNSSYSNYLGDFPDDTKNRVFKCYFVIAAIVVTSFCVLALYLQRRRKLQAEIQRRNAEDTNSRNRPDLQIARINGASISNDCQVHGSREDMLFEEWDGQGEAPPPYAPSSKPPDFGETNRLASLPLTNEGISTEHHLRSVEPPTYNEHVMAVQNENVRDVSPTRPLSCLIARISRSS